MISSPAAAVATLVVAALVIAFAGTRLARVSDRLADRTGLGEAVFGAVLLGAATSLPGMVTSVTAAAEGHPALAVSNALGGVAAQTVFLAVADFAHRRSNLEHAAASIENLLQGVLLVALLALVLCAVTGPEVELAGVHPVTAVLLLAYAFGVRLAARAGRAPLWIPRRTADSLPDVPDPENLRERGAARWWWRFAGLAVVVAAAGYTVAEAGIAVARQTGLSESLVGVLFTALATSLPELVTCVAAVRQGAPTLAVGDIIGGNSFDVLFIAFADLAFRGGSVYHAVGAEERFVLALTVLLTAVLLLGMLRRERRGIANIGFESFLVIVLYLAGVLALFLPGPLTSR